MRFILSHRLGYVALSISALWAALAAWLSMGTIGFASANGTRLGFLPLSLATLIVALAAAVAVVALLRAGAPLSPLALLALVMLPGLPVRLPAAFLIWSGPVAAVVWIAVGLLLSLSVADSIAKRRVGNRGPTPVLPGLIAAMVVSAAAWRAAPSVLSGDEPHYLVITQSLLFDHDLRIQNNHRRRDYHAYYRGELLPHVQRTGRNGEMYSIHAPGLPALILPAFAIGGYRGVQAFLIFVSGMGAALAWWVTWLATRRTDAAWLGWAAVTLCVTAVFHSFTIYPDALGGVLALTGAWALLRTSQGTDERLRPWFWHGIALSILPWLHSRFAVIACGFGALIALRLSTSRNAAAKAVAFLAVPAISAMLWLGYFIVLYGTPDPSAPYGPGEIGSFDFVPGGLAGLLFDQRFGLLPYAPVLAFGFAGLALMIVRRDSRRLGLELLFVMTSYLLTVTHFAMWWGGWSPPARFFVPVLPLLAIPMGIFWIAAARRPERIVVLASLVVTLLATIALVSIDRGRLAFNVRDTPALWLEWLSRGANLSQALPAWSRGADAPFFRDIAIWVAVVLATLFGARVAVNRLRTHTSRQVAAALTLAIAVMVAASIVWRVHGTDGRNVVASQLELLRRIASAPRGLGLDLERVRRVQVSSIPGRVRIELSRRLTSGRAAGRDDRPLFEVPGIPAGDYLITPVASAARGWLMLGIGRDQFALRTTPLSTRPEAIRLRFAIAVRGIVVRGDEDARQTVSDLLVQPVSIRAPGEWEGFARTAVKYPHAAVFFLDDRSFPEPDAFWIGGSRSSSIVVQPDDERASVGVVMRNGAVNNGVNLEVGGQRTDLALGPGEERRLAIPIDASRGAALVTVRAASGFRPSEVDPGSSDDRFLGVWMKIE